VNIGNIKPDLEESKTKKEITEKLAGHLSTPAQLEQQKQEFSDLISSGYLTQEQVEHYKVEISNFDILIKNPSLIHQTQGIDTMMIDMIQFRAMIYAFESLGENHAFIKNHFFSSWYAGISYAVFSLFGKLVDSTKGTESLKRLWEDTFKKACFPKENVNTNISKWFTHLKKNNSQSFAYRHLVTSHNSKFGQHEPVYDWTNFTWKQFDVELKQLILAWNILSKFSGSHIICPFISGEKMFDGLSAIFRPSDMQILINKYNEFIAGLDFNFLKINIYTCSTNCAEER
jgi:hypothetical protein